MTCRRSQVRVLYRPPQKSSDFRLRIFCLVAVQDSNRAALTTPVGRVSNQPSGLLLSPRFPTPRNVYQERCRQTIRSGDFFCGGRYRTRTAAEATAACGGNREPRLGQRSDFSKPCQGAAEKSANATRTGASRQIPSRFPTPRNVYRDDRRFVVGGTGREPERAKAGYHHDGGILPFALICFISRSQHPLQYSLRENSP